MNRFEEEHPELLNSDDKGKFTIENDELVVRRDISINRHSLPQLENHRLDIAATDSRLSL
jgi:hypothetical protein